MMTAQAGMTGGAPTVTMGTGNPEAEKYGRLWGEFPQYRTVAPGEQVAGIFLDQATPRPGSTVIDFGCGTGRGALALAKNGKLDVTMLDFTRNCLDEAVQQACQDDSVSIRFRKHDLETASPVTAEYGFCTDVLEHIPPEKVDQVLDHILAATRHTFFQISTVEDVCGELIDAPLHLSVHPYEWWLMQFAKRGCLIHWSQEQASSVLFYVSSWKDVKNVTKQGQLNVTDEQIRANAAVNCAAGWEQVVPHVSNDVEVMLLGGGPSLNQYVEEIRQKRADGVKLITLNGTYNWALEHGLTPSAHIMVDAREFNQRFTKPVVDGCKYLIASQCHPSVLDGLPKDRTYLWHTMAEKIEDLITAHYPLSYPVPSCTTVLNTSLPLLRMLGFRKFHLYGCDSCLAEDKAHHAYNQPENNSDVIIPVMVTGGRTFQCHTWMAAQAQQFIEVIKLLGDEIELEIYGEGLLKHILDAGASMADLAITPTESLT